jgi:hypothetical protein
MTIGPLVTFIDGLFDVELEVVGAAELDEALGAELDEALGAAGLGATVGV